MTVGKKIKKIAVVGLGSIGRRHLRLVREVRPGMQVILVRSGQGKKWPEEQLADAVVHTLPEAISIGIDAAIIATPVVFHVSDALKLIEHGIPILVEKPLSHKVALAESLYKAWLEEKTLVLLGYCLRHTSAASFFHKKIQDSIIGNILSVTIKCESYLPKWRPEQDYRNTVSARKELGGGALLELSHEIDYANWFFGPFKSVSSMLINSKTLDVDVEDMVDIFFETHNNKPVYIHLDFCSQISSRFCSVKTDKGELKWDLIKNNVTWTDENRIINTWKFQEDGDEMYINQLNHFFDCIEADGKPKVTIEDGINVLKLIDSIKAGNIRSSI
jgi:predicted dehydrogenase